MNSIKTVLNMIDCDAVDYGGVQEVPEHRIGPPYRYFDGKRPRSGNLCAEEFLLSNDEQPNKKYKKGYDVSRRYEDGRLWFKIEPRD